jgi:hypothetical protein
MNDIWAVIVVWVFPTAVVTVLVWRAWSTRSQD